MSEREIEDADDDDDDVLPYIKILNIHLDICAERVCVCVFRYTHKYVLAPASASSSDRPANIMLTLRHAPILINRTQPPFVSQ